VEQGDEPRSLRRRRGLGRNALRFALALLLLAPGLAAAQPAEPPVRVATRLVRPFVFEERGQLTGFSVELWREISQQANLRSTFLVKGTVQELLDSVRSGESALGISAISITAEREKDLDLSQPMFDAGLQILTGTRGGRTGLLRTLLAVVLSSGALLIAGLVVLLVVIIAHLVWFFERRNPHGLLADRSYYPGIFEAFWWAASTLATQADQMPRAPLARLLAVFWMFASVVFIAYFTAAVTSSLTLQQLRSDINGPDDLPGKRVASVRGSTSVEYLKQVGVDVTEFARVEDTIQSLEQGQVDAIVYDAPVLLYLSSHDWMGKAQPVGPIFRRENYGIAFPTDSPYRKPVNEALLRMKETGAYDQLYKKWFGGTGP
jgi:polar amino acid transport system substrate-binding protein